jgi:TRAP-type uncharacterized transport system substrate-binding protein
MTRTYIIPVEVEIAMTHKGAPGVPASLNYPGVPAEPPEFEIGAIYVTDLRLNESTDYTLIDAVCDNALALAAADDWADDNHEEM